MQSKYRMTENWDMNEFAIFFYFLFRLKVNDLNRELVRKARKKQRNAVEFKV